MRHKIVATCYDKRGRRLSTARNNYTKSHPLQKHFAALAGEKERIYLHAEVAALLKCGTKQPYSIVIERGIKGADGKVRPALAAPCAVCRLAIRHFGVKKVVHT